MLRDPPPPCGVLFCVMLLNLNWTRTAAAGRKKRNDFLSIVAEFRTLWRYGEVDGGADLPRVHPGGRCTRKPSQASINLRGDDEEGLDSDVINPLGVQGSVSALESFQSFMGMEFKFFNRLF